MIALEQVCKSYDGGLTHSVRGVSFRVPQGQLLVLLGGSGCGKTTTWNRQVDVQKRLSRTAAAELLEKVRARVLKGAI